MTRRDPKAVLSTPQLGIKLSHRAPVDAGILHRRPQHEKAAGYLVYFLGLHRYPGFPPGGNCD